MTLSIQNPFPGGGPFPNPLTGDVTKFSQRWAWMQSQIVNVWKNTPAAIRTLYMIKTLQQLVQGE